MCKDSLKQDFHINSCFIRPSEGNTFSENLFIVTIKTNYPETFLVGLCQIFKAAVNIFRGVDCVAVGLLTHIESHLFFFPLPAFRSGLGSNEIVSPPLSRPHDDGGFTLHLPPVKKLTR